MSVNACVYIGDLDGCSNEPVVYTLTSSTAIAVDDKVVSLTVTTPAEGKVYIRQGAWLHFGANYIVVAKDTVITSVATALDIEPTTNAIALGDTTDTWGLQRVLASNSYSNKLKFTITTSDVKNRGFEAIIYPASQSNQSIYTLIVHNNRYTFGRALVSSLGEPHSGETVTVELSLQSPFKKSVVFFAEPPTEQAKLNQVFKLSGLPAR
jgi:hypothetical protein